MQTDQSCEGLRYLVPRHRPVYYLVQTTQIAIYLKIQTTSRFALVDLPSLRQLRLSLQLRKFKDRYLGYTNLRRLPLQLCLLILPKNYRVQGTNPSNPPQWTIILLTNSLRAH